ncbi:MAG: ABC transporter ATP-binding protein [Pseudomonadota bacterium]
MFLEVKEIRKSFQGRVVLDKIDFQVEAGEIDSIIGPSGVGKTTLLAIIAGLEKADSGRVVFAKPPSKNNPVILVFQDYTLFPNMTVWDNVSFGLTVRRRPRREIREKTERLLDFFQLGPQAGQYPAELSAGQKQRTALARAMIVEPSLLLLDEPFANLDRNLKMETARYIRETQKKFGVTTISVTHDLEEAFAMSDKIGLLLHGRLEQFDSAAEVYHHPQTIEAARFLGPVNVIPLELRSFFGLGPNAASPGELVFARPENLRLSLDPQGPAWVSEVVFAGHYIVYRVRLGEAEFTVYGLSDGVRPGDRVALELHGFLKSRTP